VRPAHSSRLALSLYELSLTLRTSADVLAQLNTFHESAPLRLYHYAELINLIEVAQNCPGDAAYHLLLIGGDMLQSGNLPDENQRNSIVKIITELLKNQTVFPSFGADQHTPRSVLRRLRRMFQNAENPGIWHIRRFNTRELERVVAEQQGRSASGLPRMSEREAEAFLIAIAEPQREGWFDESPGMATLIETGRERYETLNDQRREQVNGLALLFQSWKDAYDASIRVWEIMKSDPRFEIDVLLARIELAFADFLVKAIREYIAEESHRNP
jgi:hypothetical protein